MSEKPMRFHSLSIVALCLLWVLFTGLTMTDAMAASPGEGGGMACNTDPQFSCPGAAGCSDVGLISVIMEEVKATVGDAWQTMYTNIATPMQQILGAMMMLYVIIAGLMFTMGMTQFTLSELATRTVKMIAIASFIGAGGLAFFNDTVAAAFRDGTDSIIQSMTQSMVDYLGGAGVITSVESMTGDDGTFAALDDLVLRLISPRTIMIWGALFQSYTASGAIVLGAILLAIVYLMIGIARAVWVYIVALLATTLLFGIAPIFISFALFERTKSLFEGWLSQLINFALQPILMFTFMTFFAVLMQATLADVIDQEVCYCNKASVTGSSTATAGLCFTDGNRVPLEIDFDVDGMKCFNEATGKSEKCEGLGKDFPIDPIDAITFLLLAYIAFSFYDHVISVANEISGAFIDLELGSPVRNIADSVSDRIGKVASAALTGKDVGAALGLPNLGGSPASKPTATTNRTNPNATPQNNQKPR